VTTIPDRLTRRGLLQRSVCLAVGALAPPDLVSLAVPAKSRVVLVRDARVLDGRGINGNVLADMLDATVCKLLGENDPVHAWRQVVRPHDVVGIKSNVWRHLPTPPALEQAISRRLVDAGVKAEAVGIDDRGVLEHPVFARATALINARPMRTHHWSGLGTCIKNYVMFVPDPWSYHGNACENLGVIWRKPEVDGKTRLNVLVMLTPLFHGTGPHHFNRAYTWPYAGLLASRDPVAVDTVGAAIITARRKAHFGEERPIAPSPHHIEVADRRFGLGTSSLDRIELVRLGDSRDNLI